MANITDNIILSRAHGALGKAFVLKTRGDRSFMSKYPDMSKIVPSTHQKNKRGRFKKAVKYAQYINNNPEQKAAYPIHKKGQSVYHAALQDHLNENIPAAFTYIRDNLATEADLAPGGTTIVQPIHKTESMDTQATPPTGHFNDIKATLVKIVKTLRPEDNDLPMILESWGEKLSGAETLDALNLWLHGCLEGKKEQAGQVEEIKQLDKLEPDPIPADTSDVSG